MVLDVAHAVLETSLPPARGNTVIVGTLSKTYVAMGGYVAGDKVIIDRIVNTARSFIFTTALAPPVVAAAAAAIDIAHGEEGVVLRQHLRERIDVFLPGHPSPIIPIIVGEETAAVQLSQHLLSQGVLVPAIRPPTVAVGTSRLRLAVNAQQPIDRLAWLRKELDQCVPFWQEKAAAIVSL